MTIDPVTQEILNGAFSSIAEEMAVVEYRSSYSPIIREMLDFTCGLFTADGRMIANSEQIQNPVETHRRNRLPRALPYNRLRAKRDPQARDPQHRKIVRAIANRDHLFHAEVLRAGDLLKK